MSTLGRIGLWVTLFFAAVALVCLIVLLRQARHDVQRELDAAQAVVAQLRVLALRDAAALQPDLTEGLRHVRAHWLNASDAIPQTPEPDWLTAWLYGGSVSGETLALADGRRLWVSVEPRDEVDEVRDSLVQLLALFALALVVSLLAIRWAVRRGLRVLAELLGALEQVSRGRLEVRLSGHGQPETRLLADHFNRMAGALQQARADNSELTQALLALQERERTHLAQALHDDLGQYVAGIRAQACLANALSGQPQAQRNALIGLERNCGLLQEGFRALTRELYPVMLEHLSLDAAIRQLGEQWQATQGIDCRMRLSRHLPELPLASRAHLYRLLQEALTNVARHARAGRVFIRLQSGAGHLRLWVRDDGRGAAGPVRAGIGLRSMIERARCLGGELKVLSRPGRGWAIRLDIPMLEASR